SERRQSNQTLPGSTDLPETGNGVGDNSMSVKRRTSRPVDASLCKTLPTWSKLHCLKPNPGWSMPVPPPHWLLRRLLCTGWCRPRKNDLKIKKGGVMQGSREKHQVM